MPSIKINNKDYDINDLSNEAKAQLQMLTLAEAEIKRLQTQLAIVKTAKNAYAQALSKTVNALPSGDTIKL
jgi:hypothetical protein